MATCALGLWTLDVTDVVENLAIAWIAALIICVLLLELGRLKRPQLVSGRGVGAP